MKSLGKALTLILFFVLINWINTKFEKPKLVVTKQATALNFSKDLYEILSMGNRRLVSSIMWVQTLLESDIDHYKEDDLNSWLYVRFDHITKLEPKFLAAYRFGSQYLSIIKDDDLGAAEIYERGLKQYPDDYDLNFNAGFHYLFELDQADKAVEYYRKIQFRPEAPAYLPSLVGRLERKQGKSLQDVFNIMLDSFQNAPEDSPQQKYLANQLYNIKAEIDLSCLNGDDQRDCSKLDYDGNQYIYSNGEYRAIRPWVQYKLKNR